MREVSVSVVVATYRRSEELKKALTSLKQQTFRSFEVVIVDDNGDKGWNDKVRQITEEVFKNWDLPVKQMVNSRNMGSAAARNEGIRQSAGKYITFLDDDDIYLPGKIERQFACIEEAGAELCMTDLYLYNEKDVLVDKRVRTYIKKTDPESLLCYHIKHSMTGTDTLMFSADFLRKIGGFPPIDIGDEFYLVLQAIENQCKFVYLPGCDVKAYVHGQNGGLSTGSGRIQGENAVWMKKKMYFDRLQVKDIRYINMRHYAVLAAASLNQKKYGDFVKYILIAGFVSPVGAVKLFFARKRK